MHLEDLMCRRTRLVYEVEHQGLAAVPEIAEIAAAELGWDAARTEHETAVYESRVRAEEAAAATYDDKAAVAARGQAIDIAPLRRIGTLRCRSRGVTPMPDSRRGRPGVIRSRGRHIQVGQTEERE